MTARETNGPGAAQTTSPGTRDLMREFVDVWNAADLEALRDMLADDAVLLGEGEPVRGRDAIVAGWAAEQMPATRELRILGSFVRGAGADYAFEVGRGAIEIEPPDGDPHTVTAQHTFVWRRTEPGEWEIVSLHIQDEAAVRGSAAP